MINRELLAELRFKKKITQLQLAEAAGISQSHYCNVESGKETISIKALANIAKALGCSIKDLVIDKEE